tara:strand:+ start:968 stop:1282 length:315 start_codon:yes stop_codon:yes gene_type:complete
LEGTKEVQKENQRVTKERSVYIQVGNIMEKQDRTEEAYRIIESKVNELLGDKAGYDPLEIAGVMCAQAIKIYKTCLNENDYDDIMEAIFVSRDNVEKMKGPTKH